MRSDEQSSSSRNANRRQHARFRLGLPVKLHVEGGAAPITVEVVDISAGGARLRAFACPVRGEQSATLRFLLPDQRACVAQGQVARVIPARGSEPPSAGSDTVDFVLRLDTTNDAFRGFVASLAD
jgi:hypothetical protein